MGSAGDQALLAAYSKAVWKILLPREQIELTLTEAGAPSSAGDHSLGSSGILPGGIVTAYNPGSVLRDTAENRSANLRLRIRLEASGATLYPSAASDPADGSGAWDEPGFLATGISAEALIGIAAEFQQNAVVWLEPSGAPKLLAARPGFCGAAPGDVLTPP